MTYYIQVINASYTKHATPRNKNKEKKRRQVVTRHSRYIVSQQQTPLCILPPAPASADTSSKSLLPILVLVLIKPLSTPITPNRAGLRARKRDRLAALLVIAERAEGLERLRRVQSHPAVICVNITTYITVLIGVRGARCEMLRAKCGQQCAHLPSHPPTAHTRPSSLIVIDALPGCFVL